MSIGPRAFAGSGMKTINLPASLTDIADDAFDGCITSMTATVYEGSYAQDYCDRKGIAYTLRSFDINAERENFISDMRAILSRFTDSDGYIPESATAQAFSAAVSRFSQAEAQGVISNLCVEEDSVSFDDVAVGCACFWMPRVRGIQAGSYDARIKITELNPASSADSNAAMTTLANSVAHYERGASLSGGQVTYQSFMELSYNQVIVFMGHGGLYTHAVTGGYPVLVTGQQVTDTLPQELAGQGYCLCNEANGSNVDMVVQFVPETGASYIAITPHFISTYCYSLENSFVWLGACDSAKNDRLVNAFLEKGASVVFGFNDVAREAYDCAGLQPAWQRKLLSRRQHAGYRG